VIFDSSHVGFPILEDDIIEECETTKDTTITEEFKYGFEVVEPCSLHKNIHLDKAEFSITDINDKSICVRDQTLCQRQF
jgi:hypothetical protein